MQAGCLRCRPPHSRLRRRRAWRAVHRLAPATDRCLQWCCGCTRCPWRLPPQSCCPGAHRRTACGSSCIVQGKAHKVRKSQRGGKQQARHRRRRGWGARPPGAVLVVHKGRRLLGGELGPDVGRRKAARSIRVVCSREREGSQAWQWGLRTCKHTAAAVPLICQPEYRAWVQL